MESQKKYGILMDLSQALSWMFNPFRRLPVTSAVLVGDNIEVVTREDEETHRAVFRPKDGVSVSKDLQGKTVNDATLEVTFDERLRVVEAVWVKIYPS